MHTHLTFKEAVSDSTYAKIVEFLSGIGVSVVREEKAGKMSKEDYIKKLDNAMASPTGTILRTQEDISNFLSRWKK